ncbi:MAG: hypothetical protein V7724_01805 [Sediminicola sp.]|tara:strand:- start:94545 stop:94883 length:339 start_codon:yes stop_codon:yes gene_type:complete
MEKAFRTRKQISSFIASILLMAALMFPLAVQFSHIFEGHEHPSCNDQSVHLHQEVPDCNICHFHFASYTFNITDHTDLVPTPFVEAAKTVCAEASYSFDRSNAQLRAPPVVS